MESIRKNAAEAVEAIRKQWNGKPAAGMILGTGLGGLSSQIEVACRIPYEEVPHFPKSTAPTHSGQLVCGSLHGVDVIAMEGRLHYYEGYSLQQVTFPVRVMKALGAETLVVTSAVGGLNPVYQLSDIVCLDDHIDLLPDNPLRGINDDELGPRFPDMSEPYTQELIQAATQIALQQGIQCHRGVLAVVAGPNLETRAEYRMLRGMGADIVGMSTVPEIIVAKHAGMKTVAFSVVTDMCLPDALEPADIEKIIAVANKGGKKLEVIISELFRQWA